MTRKLYGVGIALAMAAMTSTSAQSAVLELKCERHQWPQYRLKECRVKEFGLKPQGRYTS